jgi:type VI protein secretion system component VasK
MLKRSNCVNYPSQNLHNSFEQAAILKKYQRETERYRHASVWNIILGRNDAGTPECRNTGMPEHWNIIFTLKEN